MTDTNECPAEGCKTAKPRENAFCRRHWFRLPYSLRNRIWDGYRGKAGSNWSAAMDEAVKYLSAKKVRTDAEVVPS